MVHVVAADRNNVIGSGNELLWKIPDDFRHFKKITMGKPILMGRKTFESIGNALPGRDNVVITRARGFEAPGVFVVGNLHAALLLGHALAADRGLDEYCMIGGGEIYSQTFALVDRVYLTRVGANLDGDTYYPPLDSRDWARTRLGGVQKDEKNQYDCDFFLYVRRTNNRST